MKTEVHIQTLVLNDPLHTAHSTYFHFPPSLGNVHKTIQKNTNINRYGESPTAVTARYPNKPPIAVP